MAVEMHKGADGVMLWNRTNGGSAGAMGQLARTGPTRPPSRTGVGVRGEPGSRARGLPQGATGRGVGRGVRRGGRGQPRPPGATPGATPEAPEVTAGPPLSVEPDESGGVAPVPTVNLTLAQAGQAGGAPSRGRRTRPTRPPIFGFKDGGTVAPQSPRPSRSSGELIRTGLRAMSADGK